MGQAWTVRSWKAQVEDRDYTIVLRHNNTSGRRILIINDKEVWNEVAFIETTERIPFQINETTGTVKIEVDYLQHKYECRFAGETLKELTFDILDYEDRDIKITIPSHNIETIKGKPVAVFKVNITYDGATQVLRKRFRDFDTFNTYIRGAFDGHHLLSSLPKLPPKHIRLFTDHFAPAFLETRRKRLEVYCNAMARIPKVAGNPDFISFFTKKDSGRQSRPAAAKARAVGSDAKRRGDSGAGGAKPRAKGSEAKGDAGKKRAAKAGTSRKKKAERKKESDRDRTLTATTQEETARRPDSLVDVDL